MRSTSGLPWLSLIALVVSAPLGAQTDLDVRISARARAVQPGEVVRLTLTAGRALERVDAVNQGRSIPFYPVDEGRTWEALVGLDVTLASGPQAVEIHASEPGQPPEALTHSVVVVPKAFPSRHISVASRFAEPPASVRERIEREAERLAAIFSSSSRERLWTQPFGRPVHGRSTSAFGRRSIVNGQPQDPHRGADFRAPLGTTVRSPNDGAVVLAEELYFAGRTVIVDHGLGLYSLLAHLSVIRVKEGERVRRGDILGRSGMTGRVTGPHLHWAVRLGEASVDPLSLIVATE